MSELKRRIERRKKSCRHPGTWSWFTPLTTGTTRVFCCQCGKWADEIRAVKPHAAAMALQRELGGAA
jgi:anti-sigma factor ChrR (cupin superfamily)